MNWKTIFNPFEKYSEKQLMTFGIVVLLITIIVKIYFEDYNILYVNNVKTPNHIPYYTLRGNIIQIIKILPIFISLLIFGKLINIKTRAIDIFNTVAIYKFPLLIAYLLRVFWNRNNHMTINSDLKTLKTLSTDVLLNAFAVMLAILAIIYSIILLYNGFKTATNLKEKRHKLLFFILIIFIMTMSYFLTFILILTTEYIPRFLQ